MNNAPKLIYIGAPEALAKDFEQRLRALHPTLSAFCTDDRAKALERMETAEAVIGLQSHFDEALLKSAPRLRWIHALTTGTDMIVNQPALRPEMVLTSMRGIHGPQMSELVFLHMLALARDFPRMLRNQEEGLWERWTQPLLWSKTITIVGLGAIAEALAPRCKAFGMRVIGVSSTPRPLEFFDHVYARGEIEQAASESDFLVLIVPHTAETEKLIDARVIKAMKKSAYLVNVARGGVLDEEALVSALRVGRIAGAGLDVYRDKWPLPADHPLWREPGVVMTPMIGGMSDVYLDQAWPTLAHNLACFATNRFDSMLNVVSH
jgi:D-2-hydroxyacid dehydrogenase (NADP+)